MSKDPTKDILERLVALEVAVKDMQQVIDNHILHTLRQIDIRLWGLVVMLLGAFLMLWLRR